MSLLRRGDRGEQVRLLQERLNQQGASLTVDSHFGETTEAAVRAFQRHTGLVNDGVAGRKTQAALRGEDCIGMLRQSHLISAAQRLGVDLATVLAVNEVESLGAGFLADGRPSILYERHIMYRRLRQPRHPTNDLASLQLYVEALATTQPNLVNPRPGGYVGGSAEHQRLADARVIDDTCALESASWGAFQIMGYHAVRLGYASVQDFAQRMTQDENAQLDAFVRFIEADPALHKALRKRDWAVFAKGYNGPDYQRNRYDTKLARAYQRHAAAGCTAPEVA